MVNGMALSCSHGLQRTALSLLSMDIGLRKHASLPVGLWERLSLLVD